VPGLADFYVNAFGFEVNFRWPPEPEAPMEFVNLTLGECALGLGRPVEPLHGNPVTASSAPATFELCIVSDDVDSAVEHVRKHGATVLRGPVDQPWGERMAYVADPDGHPIMIYSKRS
jgi:uncharacterized glyoxalase superfamily protein PhnB